ncbi:MAG: glycosyltransferase family 4 protein [Planctomycetota bacterium]|nr:glycosyltransferase family 4 protein [Planctomycetota bacterium]
MHVWLITVGEPLPIDNDGKERLFRTGILADLMARNGHDVVFWSSSFDHVNKTQRVDTDSQFQLQDNYRLQLLHGSSYKRHVSTARFRNHQVVAQKFRQIARTYDRPDVILCSLPTLELCDEATLLGAEWNVPVVLDVRDLWPDELLSLLPRIVRPVARLAMRSMFRQARLACTRATAITGLTDEFIDWGINYAGRDRTPLDQPFPMGYVERTPNDCDRASAEMFWDLLGVTSDGDEFVACWFGMMSRCFEIETVIEAARMMQASGEAAKFVICGSGPKLNLYRQLAADCPNVLLPGWISADQIWTLLRRSTVGLAPYVNVANFVQNLPNKPIEYLSAGLPIVSSLPGVLARLLSENSCGLTYESQKPEQLVNVIRRLRAEPALREAMSQNAFRLYFKQFVAEHVYGRMQEYLKGIAGEKSVRRAA